MKVGDLVKMDLHGFELCLVIRIDKHPNWTDEQVSLYFFSGVQRRWAVSCKHVELVNECG
jgi:hypothetical protein